VNLESVIKSAVELLSPQAQAKGLTVDVHLETLPDRALADDTRIHQILLNFMSNAMKFTSQGSVTVEARYNLDDERLCCQVTDTGPGIPADRLDRLFKRFSQVDASTTRAYGGTGLGLAICKGLAEAMGGSVGASSVLGEGSRFWFEIPCAIATETVAPPASAPPFEEIDRLQGLRVLVADDNAINRELVKIILTQFGAEVAEAVGGVEAIRSAQDARYDVILMDMRMPDMDGATAAQSIRGGDGENAQTPILAFTADADDSSPMSEPGSPFNGRVAKPLIAADLIAAVVNIAAAESGDPDLPVQALALSDFQV
jgi:CheY-like chemotaxis protein